MGWARPETNPASAMKTALLLFSVLCLAQAVLQAQVVIQPAGPAVVVEKVEPTPNMRPLDTVVVRRHLSIAPRVVVAPAAPPPVEVTVPAPSAEAVAIVNRPRRVYYPDRNVVVVEEKEKARELSYVTLPVLFVKETA